ncbi:DUF2255 family protein [Pseudomonas avellanae]|uniref:DUF2255 family protein n=1 Tax=Pseudomonas avellanae TaxID=46257 RepID=UPI000B2A263D|nr:DUF2255 family protein [Pseudomonas avellanae]UQW69738.1 DUF2255 family protein [Pseudomonas avellanae]UQW76566.1 DUF2255 family protein [Pseudomonas avellanae]GGJ45062.1 hypothetical protein GCM10009085_43430 [Pseudomonas avellanae]
MNTSWRSGLFHGLTAALFICSAWGAHAAAPDESVRPSSTPTQTQAPSAEWAMDELARIIKADDLKISPFREDGVTFGTPTWIGCVEVDGALYVRAYSGTQSSWYKAAVREKAGRIIAAGMTRNVKVEAITGTLNDRIDQAYQAKYKSSQYLDPMISERSRAATVRIIPNDSGR